MNNGTVAEYDTIYLGSPVWWYTFASPIRTFLTVHDFAGKTITIPTEEDFKILTNALLLYQYVNIENKSLADAQAQLQLTGAKLKDKVTNLYAQIIPIINNYNFDRSQAQ